MSKISGQLWTGPYKRIRQWIIDRDGGLCQIRGPRCTTYATTVDHVISRIDGGSVMDPANMRAACRRCNAGASAERTNELRRVRDKTNRWYRTTDPDYEPRM